MVGFDLRNVESIHVVTENADKPRMVLIMRFRNGENKEFDLPVEALAAPHARTTRMAMTFTTKKGFWEQVQGKIEININLFPINLG